MSGPLSNAVSSPLAPAGLLQTGESLPLILALLFVPAHAAARSRGMQPVFTTITLGTMLLFIFIKGPEEVRIEPACVQNRSCVYPSRATADGEAPRSWQSIMAPIEEDKDGEEREGLCKGG